MRAGDPIGGAAAALPAGWCSDTLYEERLFEILERADGFPRVHDIERLRSLLDEFPEMDHIVAFAAFAEHWSGTRLVSPWEALRKWLRRRADDLARRGVRERPRDSVQVVLPSGVVRLVPVRRAGVRPLEAAPGGASH